MLELEWKNLNGKNRPAMKEVTMELEHIKMSLPTMKVEQNFEQNAYTMTKITRPLDGSSSSISFQHVMIDNEKKDSCN